MADDQASTRRVKPAVGKRINSGESKPTKPAPTKRAARAKRATSATAPRVKSVDGAKPVKRAAPAARIQPTKPAKPATGVGSASAPLTTQDGGNKPVDEVLRLVGELASHVFGNDSDEKATQAIEFLRRRLTGDYEVDAFGFDEQLTDTVLLPVLRPLYRRWFRVEVHGIENVPAEGAALIVANHSGTIPLDSLMTEV
ncbi:MAG TPA: hypothetical protein VIQ02_08410, partial [Jiangellaceae bacterium]